LFTAQASRKTSDVHKKKIPTPQALPSRRSQRTTLEKSKSDISDYSDNYPKFENKSELNEVRAAEESVSLFARDATWSSWDSKKKIGEQEYSLESDRDNLDSDKLLKSDYSNNLVKKMSGRSIKKGCTSSRISIESLEEQKKTFSKLSIANDEVAKITESRITSVWIHPGSDKLLVAAADKDGHLGIWDISNKNNGISKFKPHTAHVTKLHTYSNDPSKLYSVSNDGTINTFDLGKNISLTAFSAPNRKSELKSLNDASFSSEGNTIYVGNTDGTVGLIDFRSKKNSYEWCFETQNTKVNSVQQHPYNGNLLITSGMSAGGVINIHDLRKAGPSWTPMKTLNEHSKSINAAYCSPDGEFIISVGQDSTVRTWRNFTNPDEEILWTAMRHENHTGRWLSTLKPAFDPKTSATFVLGCMERPRRIEIFSPYDTIHDSSDSSNDQFSLNLLTAIYNDNLASVCSRNCFHPLLDIIVGGNSSGKVHILR
jgi:WD40 repeat protein